MAVTFRALSTGVNTTATGNSTDTEPAGAVSGDVLIAMVVADAATTIGKPAGWTQLYTGTQGGMDFEVDYIVRGGSAPSLTWTFSGSSIYREIQILALKSDTTSVVLDSQSSSGGTGNASHNPDPPATTAVASASLSVTGGASFNYTGNWAAQSGYTIRTHNTGSAYDGAMCTKSLAASGSENPAAFTGLTATGDYWDGFTVTFTDAGAAPSFVPYQPWYQQAPVLAQ
jgi:hypothetical protein